MARKRSYKKWNNAKDKHGNKQFVTCNVRVTDLGTLAKTLGVDRKGRIQSRLTDLVMQNLKDFMPRESGELIGAMRKVSETKITVSKKYARFLFFGLTKEGQPVKYNNANPLGTSHWDRRMAAARGASIARMLKLYAIGK